MTWCTSPTGCGQCGSCGMDMDMDPFCMNEQVLALSKEQDGRDRPFGLGVNHARKLCNGEHFHQHPRRQLAQPDDGPVQTVLL